MKRTLLRPTKDFSDVMESLNLDNIKPLKTIFEMSQDELQGYMDFYMQHEIPCILELIANSENEKDLKFYQEKLKQAQYRFTEFHLQHLKNFVNRKY